MIWKACERIRIRPPDVRDTWDDCDLLTKAMILGYNQIREREDLELEESKLKVIAGSRI